MDADLITGYPVTGYKINHLVSLCRIWCSNF